MLNSNLGSPIQTLKSNVDVNTIMTPGVYTLDATCTNVPTAGWYILKVTMQKAGVATRYIQELFRMSASIHGMYYRIYDVSSWTAWEATPTRAEMDTVTGNLTNTLKSGANSIDNLIVGGYSTGSGNYFDLFVPLSTSGKDVTAASVSSSTIVFLPTQRVNFSSAPTITVLATTKYGVRLELAFPSTQVANASGTVYLIGLTLTCS